MSGYNPENLIIERFGLEYDFIIKNKLTWIDNLITGNKSKGRPMDLGSPSHPNHKLSYVQTYLKKVGRRKCEANAPVIAPRSGQALCRKAIEKYLGKNAVARFEKRKQATRDNILAVMDDVDVKDALENAIRKL